MANRIKKKEETKSSYQDNVALIMGVFTLIVLCVLPLVFHDFYFDILETKYQFYSVVAIAALVIMGGYGLASGKMIEWFSKFNFQTWRKSMNVCDWAMLAFWLCNVLSWVFCKDWKWEAFWGTSGRYNGVFLMTIYIRRAEARAAVRSFGLNPDTNAHFLNLPFYETGGIKKGQLTEKDIEIIVKLLREIKPHQIYAAGDLADPHGTHRTCMEAVLGALEVVKDDEWLKECHLWLYRGAWMEWDLGMVDMAVPLSPDELIMKRHAIYRHLSQKDIMPFPGSDPREFWQRAEERTQNTAKLYDQLGMAEYQAIEVFVKMF